jgi:AAA domain
MQSVPQIQAQGTVECDDVMWHKAVSTPARPTSPSLFAKATKASVKLRMALAGPSGSGKTYTALTIARALGEHIALIDTEHGGASHYADRFDFDTLALTSFHPQEYIKALLAAAAEGYQVCIVDSLSHAWMGKDGALELVDRAVQRSHSGNSFAAWREVTPLHRQLVETLLRVPMHVLVTLRSKMEYVLDTDSRGKLVPKKVGMAPVQREGVEYEFDCVAELDQEHTLVVSKSRLSPLADLVIAKPDWTFGTQVREALWA